MTVEEYKQALKRHDWHYEYSDCHSTWERGRDERRDLRTAQLKLDPLGTIWNELCPSDFRIVRN